MDDRRTWNAFQLSADPALADYAPNPKYYRVADLYTVCPQLWAMDNLILNTFVQLWRLLQAVHMSCVQQLIKKPNQNYKYK